ncbi:hypothetical protein ACFL47_08680 [Candidatus Latescibacterota bacterium]
MKKQISTVLIVLGVLTICFAQTGKSIVSFDDLFPINQQKRMGLHKLNDNEREALRLHVESLIVALVSSSSSPSSPSKTYTSVGSGHWIKKNVDSGDYIILEDGSLWKISPIDKIDAMLWLPISNITVLNSPDIPTYDYLLVNTDDGEKVNAKYMGKE